MTCSIVIFITKIRLLFQVCLSYRILINIQRPLCPCAQLLSLSVLNFTSLFPMLAITSSDLLFVLRKTMVTSAEQGDACFLMEGRGKQCFRLSLKPCCGHPGLFEEERVFILPIGAHSVFSF